MNLSLFVKKNASKEVKASIAYTICGILNKCLALITLPIFTRIMTTEEYGLSTVYASTAAIVVIFTSLQLPYGSLSTAMIKFKDDRSGYLSSICAISSVLTLLFVVICFLARNFFEELLDLPLFLIIVMAVEMLFSTVTAAWMGWQRFEFKYKSVVIVTLSTSVLSVVCSLIAVNFSFQKGIARVISNAVIVSVFGAIILANILIKRGNPFNKKYWKFALSFNIPLVPYYLSQVIFNQSDRLMINKICGRGDAAIYGVAYSLATILVFIVTSIHSSYTPWIFEKIEKKEVVDNSRVSLILSSIIAFMLLGIVMLAPEVVYIMAGPNYSKAIWAVPPVAMSVLLLYYADLFDCILFFYESKIFLAIAAILSALINIVLNAIFIPMFGFVAAAYTTLASYMVLALFDYLYMRVLCKKHGIDGKIYNIRNLILLFIIFSAISFMIMSLYSLPYIRYGIILAVFVLIFLYRKKIIKLIKDLKNKEI